MGVVIEFPDVESGDEPAKKTYSLDEISYEDVGGMVLIEGCVPRAALEKFEDMLRTGDW